MALIIPTVESIGDGALTNALVDRSITELQDNVAATLAEDALHGCTALKKVVFGAATTVDRSVFYGCSALEVADFYQTITLRENLFAGCSALTTLILRGESMCTLYATTAISGTPITQGTGYIYVPAALLDTYKTNANWSDYAAQFRAIEDYATMCNPYTWEAVAAHIEAGDYKDVYKIGDYVPVDLGSEGVVNMQIAAFDTDTLADGSGKAAITWISKELLQTTRAMNDPNNAGWEGSGLRASLQSEVLPLIPEVVSSQIVSVARRYRLYTSTTTSFKTCYDELWIPCKSEIFGTGAYTALFPDNASRVKYIPGLTSAQKWWTRYHEAEGRYQYVDYDGGYNTMGYQSYNYAVCIGFCTGVTPPLPFCSDGTTWTGESVTTAISTTYFDGSSTEYRSSDVMYSGTPSVAVGKSTVVRLTIDGVGYECSCGYTSGVKAMYFFTCDGCPASLGGGCDFGDDAWYLVFHTAGTYTVKVEVMP